MEMSQLLSFHDVRQRLPCTGEFDAPPKFHVKELRIKDLHMNLCKRPQPHTSFVSKTKASTAETSEEHGGKAKRLRVPTESSETKYESCEDDVMEDSEAVRESLFSSKPDLPREDLRSAKCEAATPESKHFRSPISEVVDSDRCRRNPGQAPTETNPVNSPVRQSDDDAAMGESVGLDGSLSTDLSTHSSPEQGTSSKSLRHSKLPTFSGQRRQKPGRSFGAGFVYTECLVVSTDSEPDECRDRTPASRKKLRSKSPHPVRKEIVPSSTEPSEEDSGEEFSPIKKKKGTPIASKSKVFKGRTIQRGLDRKKRKATGSKSKQSKASRYAREGKSLAIRKLKYGYLSGDTSDEMDLDTDCKDRDHPTFAVEMKRSNVISGYSLTIPAEFSCKHMPDTSEYVVLQDDQGLKWEANFLPRKNTLSGGWGRFAKDHRLELDDVIVFELVKPLKFLVHVTGVSDGRRAK